jgi:glycerol-3-phosphate acyltransferase PlsY
MQIITDGLYLVFCYLLGSINSALTLTRVVKHVDIRQLGDGNAGATNVFQNVSRSLGVFVFFVDFIKGMVPLYLGDQLSISTFLIAVGGSLTVLGHDFPLIYGLRGGTGIASVFGGATYLDPRMGIQLFSFIVLVFALCWVFDVHLFNFSYIDESEAAGFILLIFLITSCGNTLLRSYFFLSLSVIVFKHRHKALEILTGRPQKDKQNNRT